MGKLLKGKKEGTMSVIQLALKNGEEPVQIGQTFLHVAVLRNFPEIVDILILAHAAVDKRDQACMHACPPLFKLPTFYGAQGRFWNCFFSVSSKR